MVRRRSVTTLTSLIGLALGVGLPLAVEACSSGPGDGSGELGLSGGSGSGGPCGIVNLANSNVGNSACGSNSAGSKAYGSSCTGNGGNPEYWCADFAKWVWGQQGADTGGLNPAASSFYSYGKSHGTLSNTPHLGDAVVFRNGTGDIHHVAIVTQVNSNGTIESVSGDWGGSHGSQAHFASTAHVKLNAPAYSSKVGTKPSGMGMTIAGYISPYGMSKSAASGCGLDAGANDSSASDDVSSSTEGGASGGEGGNDEGGNSEGGNGEGGQTDGGVAEGGADDGGSSEAGYAFIAHPPDPRRHAIDLTAGGSDALTFTWRNASGLAPPADLWIEADGRPVLQVSSIGDAPFARAQLDVAPLRASEEYRLVFVNDAHGTSLELVDARDQVVIQRRLDAAGSVDVVLPSSFFRSAVSFGSGGD